VKIGTYIQQALHSHKGRSVYRYGIVLKIISQRPPQAEVLFFPTDDHSLKKGLYILIIKLELISVLSEPP